MDPEPTLFSTGTGAAIRPRNNFLIAISTNFGTVSEDILNRALPIHLNSLGDIAGRKSAVGNPKHEFLPANREQIAAELHGMIVRWVNAGSPLDHKVCHPFSLWAKTIGGILAESGFTDFLGNYGNRKMVDDPLRAGLAILGASRPDVWLRPCEWANAVIELGLQKSLVRDADRGSDAGMARGIGKVLSGHQSETFSVELEDEDRILRLQLERQRARIGGREAHIRYRFVNLDTTADSDK